MINILILNIASLVYMITLCNCSGSDNQEEPARIQALGRRITRFVEDGRSKVEGLLAKTCVKLLVSSISA